MVGLSITVQDLAAGRLISVFSGDFERFPVRIGRHEGNDLALPAFAFVSRWHAEVRCDPSGALSLVCLAAHNPLKIAATPLATGASHPIGERLTATLSTLEFSFARRPSPALTSAPPPRDDLGPLPLIPSHPSAPRPAGPRAPEAPPQLPDLPADDRRYLARRARLQAAVDALRLVHRDYDAARRAWEDASIRALQELQRADDHEPGDARLIFREFPPADRPSLARDEDGPLIGLGELGVAAEAATELLPGLRPPANEHELRRFLARVVDVLRVFSTCTVEMQRARDRQCAELGVTWDPPSDGLGACERGEDLLRYLIDWRDPGEARSEELVRAFAGLVDHAQSFLQAALKAARGAVFSLSPSEMERTLASTWPTRTVALWRHYEATFSAFYGDTYDNLTPKFRAALAEAYSQALTRLGVAFQQHKRRGAP